MNPIATRLVALPGFLSLLGTPLLHAAEWNFDFTGSPQPGQTQVAADAAYDAAKHYGFVPGAADQPKVFAVDLEEGNYDVAIRFGDAKRDTVTTIKTETRRLVVENVKTAAGKFEARAFTVNVRQPEIAGGGNTSLNSRELGPPVSTSWDGQLSFEFNGKEPGVASISIKPAAQAVTVFLAGDSTVTDQRGEPYAGWGQMLPRFFAPGTAISNHAESGLALYSFKRQKRLENVLSMMKKGDYVLIQFGHNDQKDKSEGSGPFTSYKANLKEFVAAAREKGGLPVLLTPMERRRWKDGQPQTTLGDFAEAVRQVGAEEKVPVIDLHAMSLKLYAALGPEKSTQAFAYAKVGVFGNEKELKDDTHHNNFGGYELARCVVEGIKSNVPELAKRLAKDAGSFDPSKPDAPEALEIPTSPIKGDAEKPAGS